MSPQRVNYKYQDFIIRLYYAPLVTYVDLKASGLGIIEILSFILQIESILKFFLKSYYFSIKLKL
jgi:hypothetical protein